MYKYMYCVFQASAIGFRLVVRDMSTLQIQKLFACVDDIEQIKVLISLIHCSLGYKMAAMKNPSAPT